MGSGSSKAKSQPQKETKSSTKSRQDEIIVEKKMTKVADTSETVLSNGKKSYDASNDSSKLPTFENRKTPEVKHESKVQQNGHGLRGGSKLQTTKNLGGFASDSDSEEEDIGVVLAATRTANENRINEQNRINKERQIEQYPETYAQRLQREQYQQQQQSLFRQKTIYRNPDEWEIDENEVDSFDVRRFKEVNAPKVQSRDIFDTPASADVHVNKTYTVQHQPDPDSYYSQQPSEQSKHIPSYDTSEEALLAEIEQEYA